MNISRKRLYIGGMKCVNCQNKIEQMLKKTPGVESAKVSYQKGTADIAFDPVWVTLEELRQVIREAGYEVLLEPAVRNPDFGRTVTLLILIFFLYRMLQHSGILNLLVPSELADTGMGSICPSAFPEAPERRTADSVHFGLLFCIIWAV